MRTIIFRAQPIYEQEIKVKDFVHGDLIQYANGQIGIRQQETGYEMDVNPKTVGQFTGLLDKNGNEIYEGDIVKPNIKYITRNCQVVFDSLCFKLATKEWTNWFSEHVWLELEVIGNIFENPELLQ